MGSSKIRFTSFPRTEAPASFIPDVVDVFKKHEKKIGTASGTKGLTSNEVLRQIRSDLVQLGFGVEAGARKADKIERPVFYGENGVPTLRYEIDAYHTAWRCGLEVEAGRALMGNAIYRDLIQAMVMVQVDHLCLAVPNAYSFKSAGKWTLSRDYDNTIAVADAVFGHTRIRMPYGLTVIGY